MGEPYAPDRGVGVYRNTIPVAAVLTAASAAREITRLQAPVHD